MFIVLIVSLIKASAFQIHAPISLSMGGAGRAAHNVAEGILLNPALLAQGKNFQYTLYHTVIDEDKGLYGISLGKHEPHLLFSLGLSYMKSETNKLLQLVIAKRNHKDLSWGLSFYRIKDEKYLDWNMRAGLSMKISPLLQWGFVYSHFLSSPGEDRDFPKELAFGVEKVLNYRLLMRLDGVLLFDKKKNPKKHIIWQGGFEWNVLGPLVARTGIEKNPVQKNTYYCTGFGLRLGRLALDYGLKRVRKSRNKTHFIHSIDFRSLTW